MEDTGNDFVLAFDHFYTTNHIQIIKALLPYIDNDKTSYLPAIIKYLELKYTLSIIKQGQKPISQIKCASKNTTEEIDLEQIYNSIKNYLSADENNSIKQILNLFQTIKNMKEMQQLMELLNIDSSDNDNTLNINNNDILEMIMNMNSK